MLLDFSFDPLSSFEFFMVLFYDEYSVNSNENRHGAYSLNDLNIDIVRIH